MTAPGISALAHSFFCLLENMGVIRVSGDDAQKYLQGQFTCDLTLSPEPAFHRGAHCDHKGKMWAVVQVVPFSDGYYVLTSKDSLTPCLAELKKYGVFSKVEIEDVSDELKLVSAHSVDQSDIQALAPVAQFSTEDKNQILIISQTSAQELQQIGLPIYDASTWIGLESVAGRAQLYGDNVGQHVPQMLNLHALDAISFTKGCYTGQETVARMKYLGKLKRATFIIKGNDINAFEDDILEMELGQDKWRKAGTLLQYYIDEHQALTGLAVLPNDLAIDTRLRLKSSPESELFLAPLPYELPKD